MLVLILCRDGIETIFSKHTGHQQSQRYYTQEDLDNYFQTPKNKEVKQRKNVAYIRESSRNRIKSLEYQEEFIQEYLNSKGIILDDVYKDIASGLNYNRKQWNKLLQEVKQESIETIYITYKDRFTRFGYEWFENYCKEYNTNIIVLNNKKTSPEEELIEDLFSIIHVFSSRSYGIRRYKSKLNKEVKLTSNDNEDTQDKNLPQQE